MYEKEKDKTIQNRRIKGPCEVSKEQELTHSKKEKKNK